MLVAGVQAEHAVAQAGGSSGDRGREWTSVQTAVSGSSVLLRIQSVPRIAAFARISEICGGQDNRQHRVPFTELGD